MRDEEPAPPPKAHVEPIIYASMASFSVLLTGGLIVKLTPMWVVGVIGLFWSLVIYCFCPPTAYY